MFTLAHMSDAHLGPLPEARLLEVFGKRFFGLVNWNRKRGRHFGADTLDPLMDHMLAQGADHIAVTGDLVNLSLPAEFDTAAAFLASLGAPEDVTVVPGNHDTYVRSAMHYHLERWAPFMAGDDSAPGTPLDVHSFPFVRRRGAVAVVGVSTAIPTAVFLARGKVGHAQLRRLAAVLGRLKEEGLFRVVMIHHPPVGKRSFHRDLADARAVRLVLSRAGAELVLHGHDHHASVGAIPSADGLIPVVGVPSASAGPRDRHDPGQYNLYRIAGAPGSWTCDQVSYGYASGEEGISLRSRRRLLGSGQDLAEPAPQK